MLAILFVSSSHQSILYNMIKLWREPLDVLYIMPDTCTQTSCFKSTLGSVIGQKGVTETSSTITYARSQSECVICSHGACIKSTGHIRWHVRRCWASPVNIVWLIHIRCVRPRNQWPRWKAKLAPYFVQITKIKVGHILLTMCTFSWTEWLLSPPQ